MRREILLVFPVVGIAVSVFLLYLDLSGSLRVCTPNSIFGCSEVLSSHYSHFAGLPLSAFGLVWFIVAAVLAWRAEPSQLSTALAWGVLGVASVVALVYVELVLIGSICLFCTVAHIAGLGFFGTVLLAYRGH